MQKPIKNLPPTKLKSFLVSVISSKPNMRIRAYRNQGNFEFFGQSHCFEFVLNTWEMALRYERWEILNLGGN